MAACLIMLLTGLLKGINLLILLSYLLLGVWIVNWHLVRQNVGRVKCRRVAPGPIFVGEEIELQTEIESNDAVSVRGVAICDRGEDHDLQWLILHLADGSIVRVRWRHTFMKRGRYQLEPLRAVSQFPFGLTCRSVESTPAAEWIILPQLGAVNVDRLKQWLIRMARGDGRTRRKTQRTTLAADIHGVREYRPGDSPRLIHWRSTARRGQLLVREFEDNEAPTNLVLVVEPWLPVARKKAQIDRLEALCSLAATVCKAWCGDLSARLTLIIAKPSANFFSASTGPEFALRLLEQLAVEEGDADAGERGWFERLPPHCQSAPVLVLSSNPSSTLTKEIAAFMGREVAGAVASDALPWYESPSPIPN